MRLGLLAAEWLLSDAAMSTRDGPSTGPLRGDLHVEIFEPEGGTAQAQTVVFCHGFGGSARNFRPQVRAFRDTVRFVLYDARGHARSARRAPSAGALAYDLDALTEDLGGVIRAHGREGRVVLGGLSMGAATALSYTLRHPEQIAGLLIAAYPNPNDAMRNWALSFADSIEAQGLSNAGEQYVWGDTSRFDPQARALIKQGFLEHSEESLVGLLRGCLAQLTPIDAMAERLSMLALPTRIVVGENDAGAIESSAQLARLIPRASLSVLAKAGHVVNLESVSEFNAELRQLISQVIM